MSGAPDPSAGSYPARQTGLEEAEVMGGEGFRMEALGDLGTRLGDEDDAVKAAAQEALIGIRSEQRGTSPDAWKQYLEERDDE